LFKRSYWGDVLVTLHLPRAACFYCMIIIGSFLSPVIHYDRLILSLIATFFYLQLTAYALDELKGRHCGTTLSDKHYLYRAFVGGMGASVIGAYIIITVSIYLLPLFIIGLILVLGYNYEVLGLHSRIVFMVAWGFYPLVSNYYLQSLQLPTLTVIMFGVVAMVFAYLHIITYGNYRCRVETCKEYKLDMVNRDCHGQRCVVRRALIDKPIHKLQMKIANYEVLMLISLTIAVIVQHFGY
jgi:hypothetical protein